MPQYKKAFDIGTYTGNIGLYRVGIPAIRNVGPSGKQVAGCTRFRASNSAYLTRTPGVAGNQQIWTTSFWFKMSTINGSSGNGFYNFGGTSTSSGYLEFAFGTSGNLYLYMQGVGIALNSTQIIKDTSRWYHIVLAYDTTQATASNRVRLYLDGVEVTAFSTDARSSISQNYNTAGNGANRHVIGTVSNSGGSLYGYYDGYITEFYMVSGSQLTPSSFGEYNTDGIWVPKSYSGSYGTTGFYLPMNSSSNYATDQSGNGNNWSASGFNVSTSGYTYDLFTDSPTDYGTETGAGAVVRGSYAVMNSLFNVGGQALISDCGLTATRSTSVGFYNIEFSHFPMSSGKWYWEVTIGGTADIQIGATTNIPAERSAGVAGGSSSGYVYQNYTGNKKNNGSGVAYGATSTANDVIGVALDMDNGKIWWSKNGVWQASGNPAAGTNAAFTGITGTAYPEVGDAGATLMTGYMNFGQRAYSYTAPSGFKSLCSTNITRPADSSLWFYGDTPDLMWIKNRSTSGLHTITDNVRGMGLNQVTSSAAADTSYPAVTEMNKFGMNVLYDSTSIVNGSTNSHVYWGWKAGGANTVTNTNGTVTSQVSANTSTGFSIISFTAPASGGFTVGHGLGVTPAMFIAKDRNNAYSWSVWHQSLSNLAQAQLALNGTGAETTNVTVWNNVAPTSSVITMGVGGVMGASAKTIIYCWSAISGFSAFGKYTGNGSADGPFIYTGFRPKWILLKRSDAANDWEIWDSTRDTYNLMQNIIYANLTSAETTYVNDKLDFVSNGFKLRQGGTAVNGSAATYIYAAFAEYPFNYALAR